MAVTETIVLSSSPMRTIGSNSLGILMSSSPGLPSPNTLLQNNPQTGSQAAPIPKNSTSTFTTAASLSKITNHHADTMRKLEAPVVESDVSITAAEDAIMKKVPKSRAPRKLKVLETDSKDGVKDKVEAEVIKKPRKSRAKKQDVDKAAIEGEVKAPRKPRKKVVRGEKQLKLPKARVTKSTTDPHAQKRSRAKKAEVVSKHFANDTINGLEATKLQEDGLRLSNAMSRRSNWTPPPTARTQFENTPISPELDEDSKTKQNPDRIVNIQSEISDLIGKFGYVNNVKSNAPIGVVENPSNIKKRKLIELLKTNNAAPSPEPARKPKAVKKKATTITELATRAYADNEGQAAAPLLQYFPVEGSHQPSTETGFKVPNKPRLRNSVKSAVKAAQLSTLLSPQSALKHASNQEFVFGTSSQIAREQSPTLLRDLQQAMMESNRLEDDPFGYMLATPNVPRYTPLTRATPKGRSLWSAASRDSWGALMDIEEIDMTETPVASKIKVSAISGLAPTRPAFQYMPTPIEDDIWHTIEDSPNPAVETGISAKNCIPGVESASSGLTSKPLEAAEQIAVPSSPKLNNGQNLPPNGAQGSKDSTGMAKPDFESLTTAQLAKELAIYRFKPIKNRDQMIKLLEKCWEGKQKIALGDVSAGSHVQKSPSKSSAKIQAAHKISTVVASPNRPRGRPRKDSQTEPPSKLKPTSKAPRAKITKPPREVDLLSDDDIPLAIRLTPKKSKKATSALPDEIYDSETPCTPSPPRRLATKIGSPPGPLQLCHELEVGALLPTKQEDQLHKHISLAITSAPRSKDFKNSSWHEKMLMYDPIILEDLTAWLNTGALQKVGWDGEADVMEVKKWCTERSVCCLWKSTRSGERTRF